MKIKSQKNFWSGLMFVVVGVSFAWGAMSYTFGTSARPGPAYFPFGLGILTAVLGGVLLFTALTFEVEGGDPIGAWAWKPLLILVGSVAGFGFLLPHAGMLIALPVLVIVCSFAGDEFSWKGAIGSAVALTALSWAVFNWGLGLRLPLLPSFAG